MTPRKPTPIHCPACASELAPAFIRQSANTLAASAPRPGSAGNTRNPYGRKGKIAAMLEQLRSPNNGFISPEEAGIILCDKCLADGTREPSIGLASFPNDITCHLCANCAEEIIGPL